MPIPDDAEWDLGTDNLGKNTRKALEEAGVTPAMADGMTRQERAKIPGMGTARLARLAARLERMRTAAELPVKHPMTPGADDPLAHAKQLAAHNPIPRTLRRQIANWIEPETENSYTDHEGAMDAIEIAYPLIRDYLAGLAAATDGAL